MLDIKRVIALQRVCIVANSHADLFSMKIGFDETSHVF